MRKFLVITVFTILYSQNILSQTIKASFGGMLIMVAQLKTLEFRRDGGYEYYNVDGWFGIHTTIDSGRYTIDDNVLTLEYIKGHDTLGTSIPLKLFMTKRRVNKHKEIHGYSFDSFADEKKALFGKIGSLILADHCGQIVVYF